MCKTLQMQISKNAIDNCYRCAMICFLSNKYFNSEIIEAASYFEV